MSNNRCGGSVVPFMGSVCTGLIAILSGGLASADILSVPAEYETIQLAIDAAQNGDEVVVSGGTYTEEISFLGKEILVLGIGGPTIQSPTVPVAFVSGESLAARIDGFTIVGGGAATNGGAIKVIESFATISNCTITGSSQIRGGGVGVLFGGANITNCQITGSSSSGGALAVYESNVTISNCFVGGTAANGGGISVERDSTFNATNLTLGQDALGEILPDPFTPIPTTAAAAGGGLYAVDSTISLESVTAIECVCGNLDFGNDSQGGGLYAENCTIQSFNNCVFVLNTVEGINRAAGAGAYIIGPVRVSNGIFIGNNLASGGDFDFDGIIETDGVVQGGAIYTEGGECTLIGSTFHTNGVTTGFEAEDTKGRGCRLPNGIAEGGCVKVDGDLLIDKCTFHDPPPPAGFWLNGGNIISSLDARGGAIHAGSGDVTISNTTINSTTAQGCFELPTDPDDEDCGQFEWEGEASGGAIWTQGLVTIDSTQLGVGLAPNSAVTAFPDASGGWVFAGSGAVIKNSSDDEARNPVLLSGNASTFEEGERLSNPPLHPLGGGAIHVNGNSIMISDATISGCFSTNDGGGVNCATAQVSDSNVSGNTAIGLGGGIFAVNRGELEEDGVTVTDSVVSGNGSFGNIIVIDDEEVGAGGGGIMSDGSITLTNVEMVSNGALRGGGAFSLASMDISGGTFTANTAAIQDPFAAPPDARGGAAASVGPMTVSDIEAVTANSANAAAGPATGGAFDSLESLTVNNVVFDKNTVGGAPSIGGALFSFEVDIEDCEFSLCQSFSANASGGAVGSIGDLSVQTCEFNRCRAESTDPKVPAFGGALLVAEAQNLLIEDSLFENCFSTGFGGAVFAQATAEVEVYGSRFKSNDADLGGGGAISAIAIQQLGIAYSRFVENTAMARGGALDIDAVDGTVFNILSSQFALNESDMNGGAIYLNSPNSQLMVLRDCGIGGNSAMNGGGVFVDGGVNLACSNDIFCDNTPNDIAGDYNDQGGNTFGTGVDCNNNGLCDVIDIAIETSLDCNLNLIPDDCDIADETSTDKNGNGIPDECEENSDCNGNGINDVIDIASGKSEDCNGNGVPDECDLEGGISVDTNGDGIPDECQGDCNGNGIPDTEEIASGDEQDCNQNSIPDSCDIAEGNSTDENGDGIPDECIADCNENGVPDAIDIASGKSQDCNFNGIPDECDIAQGLTPDQNGNGVPDICECLGDIDQNGIVNGFDLSALLGGWGTEFPDITGDGTVDGLDLTILLGNWGLCN